jgi:hypothetical protein
MNPEFLEMSNLKNSGISNLTCGNLLKSMQSQTRHDTRCNPSVNYIVFI